jgi:16S rRNA (uracil1498-N3)-methyltransferase
MEADVVAGGFVFHAEIAAVSPEEIRFNLLAELEADPALPITLVVSIFKFDHMEWGIEKATELGVTTIAPVIARRTEKHLAQAAAKRVERWRRIAHEAAKQSRRSDVPEILDPQLLAERVKAVGDGVTRIVLAEQERGVTLRSVLEEAMAAENNEMPKLELAFGPEGGWAPEEEALFDANGWRAASLGPRILRAETAAIAALAVVGSFLE